MVMREFKFRAWSTEYKRFLDCECSQFQNYMHGYANPVARSVGLKTITLQQYIGLKDKNGKEIYEGDIIRYYNDDSYTITDKNLICKYSPNNAWFTFGEESEEEDDGYYWLEIRNFCEVIGNIFENPDLIK